MGLSTRLIGIAAAAMMLAACSSPAPSGSASPSLAGGVVGAIQVPDLPGAAAAGFGSLWVSDYKHGGLVRVSGSTRLSLTRIRVGDPGALQPDCQPDQEDAPAGSSNVNRDVPPGSRWGGTPAKPVRAWFRELTTLARLAERSGRDELGGPKE